MDLFTPENLGSLALFGSSIAAFLAFLYRSLAGKRFTEMQKQHDNLVTKVDTFVASAKTLSDTHAERIVLLEKEAAVNVVERKNIQLVLSELRDGQKTQQDMLIKLIGRSSQ